MILKKGRFEIDIDIIENNSFQKRGKRIFEIDVVGNEILVLMKISISYILFVFEQKGKSFGKFIKSKANCKSKSPNSNRFHHSQIFKLFRNQIVFKNLLLLE